MLVQVGTACDDASQMPFKDCREIPGDDRGASGENLGDGVGGVNGGAHAYRRRGRLTEDDEKFHPGTAPPAAATTRTSFLPSPQSTLSILQLQSSFFASHVRMII